MTRKKMASNPYEGMSYKLKIVPVYSPCSWGIGVWESGKEHKIGGAHFTGTEQHSLQGYQIVVMGILDGDEFAIVEPLAHWATDSGGIVKLLENPMFDSIEDAKKYLSSINLPDEFKPFVSRYPRGELYGLS